MLKPFHLQEVYKPKMAIAKLNKRTLEKDVSRRGVICSNLRGAGEFLRNMSTFDYLIMQTDEMLQLP
jgi:hypothetical protein